MTLSRRLKNAALSLYLAVVKLLLQPYLQWLWRVNQRVASQRPVGSRVLEYAFALKWVMRTWPKEVLDVGSGTSAFPAILAAGGGRRVTAIDEPGSYWKGDLFNRHYNIVREDITRPRMERQFDFITCIGVLEHIPNHRDAVKGMFTLLRPGGHMMLSFPYNEKRYVENVYALDGVGYGRDQHFVCQIYSRKELEEWLRDGPGEIVEQAYYRIFTGDLWAFGERLQPPIEVSETECHHTTCLLIRKTG